MANSKFKSPVWQHFDFLVTDGVMDKTITVCKLCKTQIKYATGSTSSMNAHMSRKHGVSSTKVTSSAEKSKEHEHKRTASGQLSLHESFALKNKFSRTSTRHAEITRSIGLFIAKDMRPFSVMENQGFANMIHVLEPRYNMPGRSHFSEKVIPKLYQEARETVSQGLNGADFVAVTTDAWTSRATQSYNTVTAHFIQNWEMKSFVLQTRIMHESHTAEHLSELLISAVAEWDLKRRGEMPSLTTDNAKNIMNAGKLAGFQPHVGCVAHTINLATQRGLQVPQLSRLLGRIRRVVTYFHKSSTAMAILKNKQTLVELPQHKLIMDVSTRWNSTYDMLDRFLEQQPAVEATLLTKDLKNKFKDVYTLSEENISSVEKVLMVLKPIKTVTTILCAEASPTVSLIHPLKEMLLQQLRAPDDEDGPIVVTALKTAIHNDLEPRYRIFI